MPRGRPPSRGAPPSHERPWDGPRQARDWSRPEPDWLQAGHDVPRPSVALPAPDLLGPDEELVAGRRPVEEAFAAGRPALRLLVVPQRREPLEKLVLHATRLRIPIIELEGGSLTALAGFDGHQGIALVVEPRVFASLDDILARAAERTEPPFVLVLDSLEDPQNVGTLLRSAEAAGIHGVVFPTRRQAPLTPAAIKASAGAVEHLLLCPVDDLAGALADLHGHGLRVAGSEADAPLTARQADLRGPLAIVVGSEGQGLGPAVRRRCDLLMRIPMRGAVGSLNAAVAGSILLFEAVAQRDPVGRIGSSSAADTEAEGAVGEPPAEPTAEPPHTAAKPRRTRTPRPKGT
jgi:23S rRNA (guanosine2251-2'-O)-methyltransferase